MRVLCIDNLHPYEIDPKARDIRCPTCGCVYVRTAKVAIPVVTVLVGRERVEVYETWLRNRGVFAAKAREAYPQLSDAELQQMVGAWFPPEEE